jgi:hypothetical protein
LECLVEARYERFGEGIRQVARRLARIDVIASIANYHGQSPSCRENRHQGWVW